MTCEAMMPVAQKSAISFALVHIPVELFLATQDNDIHFNQLTSDMKRVRYRKTDGAGHELKNDDIVRGFQYEKDRYVIVTDDDIEKIKTEKDNSIDILLFTDLSSIPTVYFNKSYYCVSGKGSEKAFELLQRAMKETGKVAIGKTVIGTKETMLALVPEKDGILLQTLYFHDEIREILKERAHPPVNKQELEMATRLIGSMENPFEPENYHDEYQMQLKAMIEDKIEGKEVVAAKPVKSGNVIDLMDALKASLEQNRPKKSRSTQRKTG